MRPAIIRGNASEIMSLAGAAGAGGKGVDSTASSDAALIAARGLARKTGAVVAVTGATDYVTDGTLLIAIDGGDALMPLSTALGCALSATIGRLLRRAPAAGGGRRRARRLWRRRCRGGLEGHRAGPSAGRALRRALPDGPGDAVEACEDRADRRRLMLKAGVDLSVYLITDRRLAGERGVVATVAAAVAGGVGIVQLRDPEATARELVELARALVALLGRWAFRSSSTTASMSRSLRMPTASMSARATSRPPIAGA